ncbi:glutaredoxin [Amycolatopsis echigonensis]|uniref:Glutaredoxin n=2 Tax=Pseudonocardiaceae TaxID=2070 RepID=A0A2N3WJK0_9PSEU|nr:MULTISPECIES: glutaredoxin domain-containing protein [Pseudonocardiaceae]AEA23518.1 glutaredoxin [Pseudonocardia dioxanivorans CB1190]PKV94032.1 glutaredoxin [Amycolatopsis niigatensis]
MSADPAATVYWRPGCPYCSRLLGDLDRIGLPVTKVNIWADRAAAARVRAVAGGNETVPTVVVGDTAMVNPRAGAVLDAVRAHAPDVLADLDVDGMTARAAGPWQAGLAVTLLAAAGWFALATANPTTSYHLAPAVVAAAWPIARRLRAGRPLPIGAAALTAFGGALIAVAVTLLLSARDALAGPILFGVPPLTEALLSVALGFVVGTVLSLVGRRKKAG